MQADLVTNVIWQAVEGAVYQLKSPRWHRAQLFMELPVLHGFWTSYVILQSAGFLGPLIKKISHFWTQEDFAFSLMVPAFCTQLSPPEICKVPTFWKVLMKLSDCQ